LRIFLPRATMGLRSGFYCGLKKRKGTAMKRDAMTRADVMTVLCVTAGLCVLLGPMFVGGSGDAEAGWLLGGNHRSGCQANLKSIGTGILEYGRANNGAFPRLPDSNRNITAGTGNPFQAWKTAGDLDDIGATHMNNVWTMIDEGLVPVTGFKCPADRRYAPRTSAQLCGWAASTEYSFGLHYVYSKRWNVPERKAAKESNPGAVDREYDDRVAETAANGIRPNHIVMADKNPVTANPLTGQGGSAKKFGQSNHTGSISYLTRSGNVAFREAKDSSIINGDEIYLAGSEGKSFGPKTNTDIVIVADPAARTKPPGMTKPATPPK